MVIINPHYSGDPMALDYVREFQDISRVTKGGGPSQNSRRSRGASVIAWEKGKPAGIGGGHFFWRVFVRLRDEDEWIPCDGNKPTEAWWPKDLFTAEQIEEHRARLKEPGL